MESSLDLLIKGGTVIDGTGSPGRRADVGVRDGRIVTVGEIAADARETVDATGQVVAPGIIDIHTHYDAQAFWDPSLSPSSLHGVTTVIGGNCGFSIAPLSGRKEDAEYLMSMLSRVEGMSLDSLREGVAWDWTSFGEYLSRLDGKLSLNAGFMVGHSALRRTVMGERAVGKATPDEIAAMQNLLRESIAAGGLGLSSTISRSHNDAAGDPVPSRAASDDELMALARVVSEFEGTTIEFLPDVLGGLDEAQMRRMSDLSLAAQRPLNWNLISPDSQMPDMHVTQLSASDYAAARGAKVVGLVTTQVINVCVNFISGFVFDGIPGWAPLFRASREERKKRLADPELRKMLEAGVRSPEAPMYAGVADWRKWTFGEIFEPANKKFEGQSVGAVAEQLGKDPFDTMIDFVIADDLRTILIVPVRGADDESWRLRGEVWRDDRVVIGGSDAGAHLDMIDTFAYSSALLGEGVRERGLLTLEEAIRKLTDVPAKLLGIKDRGQVTAGYWADLFIFDPDTVDRGPIYTRFDLPAKAGRLYADAVGVSRVIVNGETIVQHNQPKAVAAGRILRAGRDTYTVALQ